MCPPLQVSVAGAPLSQLRAAVSITQDTHTLGPTLGVPPGFHSARSGSHCTGEAHSCWTLLPQARPPRPALG